MRCSAILGKDCTTAKRATLVVRGLYCFPLQSKSAQVGHSL